MHKPSTYPAARARTCASLFAALLALTGNPVPACDFPGLDAEADLALHATVPKAVAASVDEARAPAVSAGALWEVTLHPLDAVNFARPPGREAAVATHAGLLRFPVPTRGRWRVALSDGSWVDLVDGGVIVPSFKHGGDGACERMHKVVDFHVPLEREVLIQLSGARATKLRLSLRPLP